LLGIARVIELLRRDRIETVLQDYEVIGTLGEESLIKLSIKRS
jgi:hypothetical protein